MCCSRLTARILSDLYLINTGERLGKVRELHFPSPALLNWERNFKKERKSSLLNLSLTKLFCNGPFNAQRGKGIASLTKLYQAPSLRPRFKTQ